MMHSTRGKGFVSSVLFLCATFFCGAYCAPFETIGCYQDLSTRAIPTLEGQDSILDGKYDQRENPISKCYEAAKKRGFFLFAVQNGGGCAASVRAAMTFDKYGNSTACKSDGEGGLWANQVYVIKGYDSIGCYKDTPSPGDGQRGDPGDEGPSSRAIETLEGTDHILDGSYSTRENPIAKCAVAAMRAGQSMFAVQNGGWCAASATAPQTYKKYGNSTACKADGKGGPWANQVYVFKGHEKQNTVINGHEKQNTVINGYEHRAKGVKGYEHDAKGVKGYEHHAKGVKGYVRHVKGVKGYERHVKGVKGYEHHAKGVKGQTNQTSGVKGYEHRAKGVKGYEHHAKGVKGYQRHVKGVKGYEHHAKGVKGYEHHAKGVKGQTNQTSGVKGYEHRAKPKGVKGYEHYAKGVKGYQQHAKGVKGQTNQTSGVKGYEHHAKGVKGYERHAKGVKGYEHHAKGVKGQTNQTSGVKGYEHHAKGVKGYERHAKGVKGYERHVKGVKGYEHHAKGVKGQTNQTSGVKGNEHHAKGVKGYERHVKGVKGYEHHAKGVKGYERHVKGVKGYERNAKGVKGYERHAKGVKGYEHQAKGVKGYIYQGSGTEGYDSIGCYNDTSNHAIRSLEGNAPVLDGLYSSRANPIAKCAVAAITAGYSMFAVQNGGLCASSATAPHAFDKYGPSTACQEDGEGGPWANQVFVLKGYHSVGCYKDNSSRAIRTLEGTDPILDGPFYHRVNPVAKCAVAAMRAGHSMFAVQNGGWCSASATAPQTFDKYGKSTACNAYGEGGWWANEVYILGYDSIGCYKDTPRPGDGQRGDPGDEGPSSRAIETLEGTDPILDGSYSTRENPIVKCAVAAMRAGYKMFAVQNGGWCAASATALQTFDDYGKSTACKGDGEGGPSANHVYLVKC